MLRAGLVVAVACVASLAQEGVSGMAGDMPDRGDVFLEQPNALGVVASVPNPVSYYSDNPQVLGKAKEWHVVMDHEDTSYGHNIMGGLRDSASLAWYWSFEGDDRTSLPHNIWVGPDHVIEDIAPRWADVTGDALPEVVTVTSSFDEGGRLSIYDPISGAEPIHGPHIGRRNRWLAIAGIADLDGDGQNDIAYVDRPHLAKILRFWTVRDGALVEIASGDGFTNHRIGEETITSAVRTCDGISQIVTVDAGWSRILASHVVDGTVQTEDLGVYRGPASLAEAAHTCS